MNQYALFFLCPNPWNENLAQVESKSFQGSWELLWIFKGLFVFTLEKQALASELLNPLLRTQRQSEGMLNVNGQNAPAPSERRRVGGARSDLLVFSRAVMRTRSENCTHSAKCVHLHKLQKIIPG